jgi:hypothetical protein
VYLLLIVSKFFLICPSSSTQQPKAVMILKQMSASLNEVHSRKKKEQTRAALFKLTAEQSIKRVRKHEGYRVAVVGMRVDPNSEPPREV